MQLKFLKRWFVLIEVTDINHIKNFMMTLIQRVTYILKSLLNITRIINGSKRI